jgi:broad specificity phosphatase PhoE
MVYCTVIRHPESEANGNLETHIIAWGGIDVGFSVYGQKSVELFWNFYRSQFKNSIYVSSPMQRCKWLWLHNLSAEKLLIDTRLQERDFWIHTGQTKRQMLDLFQSDHPQDPAGDNFSEWMDKEWLWFESNRLLKIRLSNCIQDIQKRYPQKNIVCITHTGIIRSMISLFTGTPEKDINDVYNFKRIDNLSISQFHKSGKNRETVYINHIPSSLQNQLDDLRTSLL